MDQKKTGALIRVLRLEKGLTQQGLAELLGVSNRAVSKWERGLGSPDLSLLPALSLQLGVDLAGLLSGGLPEPDNTGGSMKHIRFFVCPQCGDLITATGEAAVSCCGRRLGAPARPEAGRGPQPPDPSGGGRVVHHLRPPHGERALPVLFGPGHRRAGHRDEVLARVGPPAAHPPPGTRDALLALHAARPVPTGPVSGRRSEGERARGAHQGAARSFSSLSQFQKSVFSFRPMEAARNTGSFPSRRWLV